MKMTREQAEKAVDAWAKDMRHSFYHDPDIVNCPSGLRWKNPRTPHTKRGDMAGALDDKGKYWSVRACRAHHIVACLLDLPLWRELRIAWTMRCGQYEYVVDHIQGTEAGNVKGNLRVVSTKVNTNNRKEHREGFEGKLTFCMRRGVWEVYLGSEYISSSEHYHFACCILGDVIEKQAQDIPLDTIKKEAMADVKQFRAFWRLKGKVEHDLYMRR